MAEAVPESLGRATGFAAFSAAGADVATTRAQVVAEANDGIVIPLEPGCSVAVWGEYARTRLAEEPLALVRGGRIATRDVTLADLRGWLADPTASTAHILPPYAGLGWDASVRRLACVTDWLGFRQVYAARDGAEVALASSAAALATGRALDPTAFAAQSLLGWQPGDRTPYADVTKVAAGARVELGAGTLTVTPPEGTVAPVVDSPATVARAAGLIRDFVCAYLDDHPDTLLQLTGGLDSRILLAAIPPARRQHVTALTLHDPESDDLRIAADLTARDDMQHRIIDLAGLDALSPAEAYAWCRSAAERVDGMADPLAFAAVAWAERGVADQPRLSGLGGEAARGFYYFGPDLPVPVTRRMVDQLAGWRMFVNERVADEALAPAFLAERREHTVDAVFQVMRDTQLPWWPATDEFYLFGRMQRWAGVLATARCQDRASVNPMLQRDFLDIARGLPPAAKRNMGFLAAILMHLDAQLAAIPLEGRPAPQVYAHRGPTRTGRLAALQVGKVYRKAQQRRTSGAHVPIGGGALAARVVEHWRENPGDLEAIAPLGIVSQPWLERLVDGGDADAATVGFVLNLVSAQLSTGGRA